MIYCFGLWLCGFCMDLPNWLGWSDHTFSLKDMLCTVDRDQGSSYTIFLTIVAFGELCSTCIFLCVHTDISVISKITEARPSR